MSEVNVYHKVANYDFDQDAGQYTPVFLLSELEVEPPITDIELLSSITQTEYPDSVILNHVRTDSARTVLEARIDGKRVTEAELILDGVANGIEELHPDRVRGRNYTPPIQQGDNLTFPLIKHRIQYRRTS